MRFSVRAFIFILCFSFVALLQFPTIALAQGYSTTTQQSTYDPRYVDSNVPVNQNTKVQLLVIDILTAVVCQLGGIDPIDPKRPCITVDPVTRKLGYGTTQFDENGNPRVGGLIGATSSMIGMLYTPTVSSRDYTQYLAQNFGIVKPAYAQEEGYGFRGLNPLMQLWTAVRNIAYFLLMVAFVIIGLGIMLRVKVDPRTVMTLQNQIPRIIICILLVTFSYGIAGLMVDTMWLTTYLGINVITSAGGESTNILGGETEMPLSQLATKSLLQTPFWFVNEVFSTGDSTGPLDSGIENLTTQVSFGLGSFLEQIVRGFLGVTMNDSCAGWTGINFAACVATLFGFIASILLWLVILVTILRVLFSIWFTLLKAYTFIIFFTIGGPIFIALGLLPGKPYGFEKWLRSLTANLGAFPATVWALVVARLFMELFSDSAPDQFIPPLIFQPNIGIWGVMLAFGVFLMTPTMLAMLQESLKVPGTKYGSSIGAGLAAGASVPKAGAGFMWNRATRKAKLHEYDAGWLRSRFASWGADKKERLEQQNSHTTWSRNPIKQAKKWFYGKAAATHQYDMFGNPTGKGGGGGGH